LKLLRLPKTHIVAGLALAMSIATGGVGLCQQASLEFYTGYYSASSDAVGDETIYGLRGSYDVWERIGVELSAGQFDNRAEIVIDPADPERTVRLQVFLFDLSILWRPFGESWIFFVGPGLVDVDYEVYDDLPVRDLETARDFSWHWGAAYRWYLNEGFYLRGDLRARYSSNDLYSAEDYEVTVAAGWRF
jgi:hypothetical protein